VEAYLALREGRCDLFASALELEPGYSACDASCPTVPPGGRFQLGDYDYAGGWSEAIRASICCLEYSAPYVFDGFALLSRAQAPQLLATFANSPDVINVGLFMLLLIFVVA
jgi:hypothetical protein